MYTKKLFTKKQIFLVKHYHVNLKIFYVIDNIILDRIIETITFI